VIRLQTQPQVTTALLEEPGALEYDSVSAFHWEELTTYGDGEVCTAARREEFSRNKPDEADERMRYVMCVRWSF